MPTSILITMFGLVVLAFGLLDYAGVTQTMTKRMWMVISLVYAEVPMGLCFTLIGLGALIARRPITDWLLIIGLACGAIGVLLIFWHPKWVRPPWLRGPLGD